MRIVLFGQLHLKAIEVSNLRPALGIIYWPPDMAIGMPPIIAYRKLVSKPGTGIPRVKSAIILRTARWDSVNFHAHSYLQLEVSRKQG
jgi:hypothetical protein